MRRDITAVYSMLLVSAIFNGCQAKEDGQFKPLLANPEIAIPVAVANNVMGKSPTKVMKGEIIQDPNCMRVYPISRLRVELHALDADVKPEFRNKTFYPNDRVFQKEIELDSKSRYKVQLMYDPTNEILAKKKTSVSETFEVFLRISCQP